MGVMTDPLTSDLFPQALLPVTLKGPADFEGFRRAARQLLAQHMLPEQVSWHTSAAPMQDLFGGAGETPAVFGDAPAIQVPPEFMSLCESAILHSDARRFGLLYRLLWRLVHEPSLRHDPLDADMAEAQRLAQAVRRDMHKMKAFVRFRAVQDDTFRNHPEGGPLHVAWFEPEHHIVEAVAPFFARRFTQMRWAVLTPECSAQWNGAELQFGPGAKKEDAPPPDAGEQLWLTYYQHIFNPARLKVRMMQKEMPLKYWRNLPEAGLIAPLVSNAHQRSSRMVAQPASVLARRIPTAPTLVAARTSLPPEGAVLARGGPSRGTTTAPTLVAARTSLPPEGAVLARGGPSRGTTTAPTLVAARTSLPPAGAVLARGGPSRGLPESATQLARATEPAAGPRALSLDTLKSATDRCRECPIGEFATQSVCGEGPRKARLMFVGEQPGDQEDLQGKPFVGPAGQLLDRALQQLGINRDKVFVSNAVKHFKYELRGKRRIHKTPTQREASACLHWLEDEIRLVQPAVLVALGATAARSLMGKAVPVLANRGQLLQRDDGRQVLITLHPSALLRTPPEERDAAYAAWLADLDHLKPLMN